MHVPWEKVNGLWATKSEGVGLIVRVGLIIVSKIFNLCGPDPPTFSNCECEYDQIRAAKKVKLVVIRYVLSSFKTRSPSTPRFRRLYGASPPRLSLAPNTNS